MIDLGDRDFGNSCCDVFGVTLTDVTTDGYALTADVTYSGGCGQHRMDLVAWGGWLESFPVQVNGLVTHDDGDDACDAIVTEERVFDLRPRSQERAAVAVELKGGQ